MSDDPLREYIQGWLDTQIAEEEDDEVRARLAFNRRKIVDFVELQLLREALSERDQHPTIVPLKRKNGAAH
jgi:hypothetical protein